MNLVAKEAPLVNKRDGVLVLSETPAHRNSHPGADCEPVDVSGQAEAIYAALTMPADEKRARIDAISRHVREHHIGAWIDLQLADVDEAIGVAGSRIRS
jgi:trehalose 6-phosphate synthase